MNFKDYEINYFNDILTRFYADDTRNRMAAHRPNSKTLDNASQEVSVHLYNCAKGFHALPTFKVREENKIARLVK